MCIGLYTSADVLFEVGDEELEDGAGRGVCDFWVGGYVHFVGYGGGENGWWEWWGGEEMWLVIVGGILLYHYCTAVLIDGRSLFDGS
jgi:hypothetical protein